MYYRGLILLVILLILLYVSVIRPSSGRNILLARITRLTTDPLFLEYSEHYSDQFYSWLLNSCGWCYTPIERKPGGKRNTTKNSHQTNTQEDRDLSYITTDTTEQTADLQS
jgi:hypothetical protein